MADLHPVKSRFFEKPENWFLLLSFLFLLLLLLIAPVQIINSDSVSGFDALKGWKNSGRFNCAIRPNTSDISTFNTEFLTWWSPGQYLFPYFIQSIFPLTLGTTVVVLNFLCVFIGMIGFLKVFKFYNFSPEIIIGSLILILSSNTVLYRFISYQGGESLSFLYFPWILYWYIRVEKLLYRALLIVPFIIIGFITKSQLLIALPPLLLLIPVSNELQYIFVNRKLPVNWKRAFMVAGVTAFSVIVATALLYQFFLSKGGNPSTTSHFNPSAIDVLVPLASPITAISSLSEILLKMQDHLLLQVLAYAVCAVIVLFTFYKTWLRNNYIFNLGIYYLIYSSIFIFLYLYDSNIDYSTRHFKFVGYLFFPVILMFISKVLPAWSIRIGLAGILCFSVFNYYRLSKVWFKDTYVAQDGFRITNDEFPQALNTYMMGVPKNEKAFFFSPFESRWAIDRTNIICVNNEGANIYYGHGYPIWFIKEMKPADTNDVAKRFPGYKVDFTREFGKYQLIRLK